MRLLLWTAWKALRDPAAARAAAARWASWGVAGIKVDFLLSDSAARMAIYDDIARDAARHRLVVDFHGCTIPRGIQRTWPNVLTMEAVEGAERETPGQGTQAMDPRHDVDLAFTRNVVGSMDYTPVTFSARNRGRTDAHRLALAVVFESGCSTSPTPRRATRDTRRRALLRDLPDAWDDVRLLAGAPEREVDVARRAGDRWWIGSLSALDAHRQTVPLGFLDPGRTYAAPGPRRRPRRAGGRGPRGHRRRPASVSLERNGGFVAELTPPG